jgi:LacI family transcriptional regulator
MAGRVTLQDIADELGLSRNTVSKAINNTGVLADSTRERVLRKAKEMGYKQFTYLQFKEDFTTELGILTHSNSTASGERKKEIAVLSSGFIGGSHFAQRMIDRFQHDFSAVGYSISMYRVMPEEIQSLRLPSSFDPENISGIMCIELFQADYCRMLCSLNLPVLLVDGPVSVFEGSFAADQLLMDSQSQLFSFLREMQNRGKSKISFIGDIRHCQSFYDRYSALRQYGAFHGLTDDWSITGGSIAADPDGYVAYLEESLKGLTSLPDVFLCANDFVALDVLTIFRKLGIRVPEDLWLCGFDDSPESQIVIPSLTTIHIHSQIMGQAAVNLLYSRIHAPYINYRTVYTETNLIYRNSTGD